MGFLPGRPDGNADGLRGGACAWEGLAHDLWVMENDLGARGPGSVHDWWRGAASAAYVADWQRVAGAFGDVDHQLHAVGRALLDAAGQIEEAQHTYDGIAAGIGLTTAVGIGLTVLTAGISDVAAGGVDAAEVGAATTAIDVLGGAVRGFIGTLEAIVLELEAAIARVALLLGQLPPVVVEAGSGAALSTGMAYALGERDRKALAMWGVVGAASGLDGGDDELDPDRDGVDVPRQIDISFGHGARHLEGTGLDQAEVENAIRAQVGQALSGASSSGEFWGRVTVDGQTVEYRTFTLANGTINVGTYYVVP